MKNAVLGAALLCAACSATDDFRPPPPAETAMRASYEQALAATKHAMREAKLAGIRTDEESGLVTGSTRHRRLSAYFDTREVEEELNAIADISHASRFDIEDWGEYRVRYAARVEPAGKQESRVRVTVDIVAVERSQGVMLGPGVVAAVPRFVPLRSRGVLEREMLRRIGDHVTRPSSRR